MKTEIAVTIVLLMLVVALVLGMKLYSGSFENSDAKKFVLEDLASKYPAADRIEIVGYEPRVNAAGGQYYAIKAAVSEGLATPCPTRTNFYYNYPEQNFVPAPPEYVVRNCTVCANRPCVIAFPEEAIIASHTLPGSRAVQEYIEAVDAVPLAARGQQGWDVVWTSPLNYSYEVFVSDDGYISGVERKETAR